MNIVFVELLKTPLDNILAHFEGKHVIAETVCVPLGIMYLSAYIKENNDVEQVGLIDYPLIPLSDYNDLDEYILAGIKSIDFRPDFIAISLNYTTAHHFFLAVLEQLKACWPDATTVVGGTHATFYTEGIAKKVDFVIGGEGELSFSEFIREYPYVEDIPGVTQLTMSEAVSDLDTIPDWDLIDVEAYRKSAGIHPRDGRRREYEAMILTSRGCPIGCKFCANYIIHGRKMRLRSTESVLAEMKELRTRYGFNRFVIFDDYFGGKKRILELLNRVVEEGFVVTGYPNGLHVNSLDKQMLNAMIEAGMEVATIAIESGSQHIQDYLNNKVDLDKAKELVSYLYRRGIIVRIYMMLGFPGETKERMFETIDYAKQLDADWVHFAIATPLLGTEMHREFTEMGCLRDNPDRWRVASRMHRDFDTLEISATELNDLMYLANLEVNFVYNTNIEKGNWQRARDLFEGILKLYPHHIIALDGIMRCNTKLGYNSMGEFWQIANLVANDERAGEMRQKYSYLMRYFP